MRTVDMIEDEIIAALAVGGPGSVADVLRQWAEEIVDECADEADLKGWPSETIDITSILKVKEQL